MTADGSEAYRGCISDLATDGIDFCMQNFAQCNICARRACNSHQLEFEKKLKCVKCDPDENSNCNVIDEKVKATECARTTLGYKNECYTYQNGSFTQRGCLYEATADIFSECSDHMLSDTCTLCDKTDCNRTPIVKNDLTFNAFHFLITNEGNKPKFTPCGNSSCTKLNSWQRRCYKCDSTTDTKCASDPSTSLELCPYAEEDLGCYHMVTREIPFDRLLLLIFLLFFSKHSFFSRPKSQAWLRCGIGR